MLFRSLWFPYIALAWYDYTYECKSKLGPTPVPFGRYIWLPFKPPGYKKEYENLPEYKKGIMDNVDHLAGWSLLIAVIAVAIKYLA